VAGSQPSSRRPYLLRAMHEWMTDNGLTPHLMVDADVAGVVVPTEFINDGKIILNISHDATQGLMLRNECVEFQARFGGTPMSVYLPIESVLGIYARESGQGMIFAEKEAEPEPPDGSGGAPEKAGRASHLKLVK